VKELEQYRLDAIASLSEKKDKIIEEENQKALESARKSSDSYKNESEKYLKTVQKRNHKVLDAMETLYKKNSEKWAKELFENAITD
ncbi:MAG: hypothetical protein KBT46_04555, partial [Ruminococcus sp.]|nr:hypothetical protein [Candidatus Copronaster equi]